MEGNQKIIGWTDWVDNDRIDKTGEFFVHRNYINDNGSYNYIPYASPDRTFTETNQNSNIEPKYIDQTVPLAKGILAFFVCSHYNRPCLKTYLKSGKNFKTDELYKEYFSYRIREEYKKNNRLPNPDTEDNIRKRFIPLHLKDEQVKLTESMKYFEECKDETDVETNRRLRDYVDGYFNWLTGTIKTESDTKLSDVCKGEKEYMALKAWLVDQELVDPDTLKWKDRKTGHKKDIATYIKTLHIKNYTDHLDDNVIQSIAKNTFGVEVKPSTIHHAKPNPDLKIPAFIDV